MIHLLVSLEFEKLYKSKLLKNLIKFFESKGETVLMNEIQARATNKGPVNVLFKILSANEKVWQRIGELLHNQPISFSIYTVSLILKFMEY